MPYRSAACSHLRGHALDPPLAALQTGSVVIQCYTIPGYGSKLSWTVYMAGSVVQTTLISGLLTSYSPPVLSLVTQTPLGVYLFPTAGAASVSITGSGFGPIGTPVAVTYAYPSLAAFSLTAAVVASDTSITGQMGPGCGANLPVTVAIGLGATGALIGGENVVSTSAAPNSTMLYYSPPQNDWSGSSAPSFYITTSTASGHPYAGPPINLLTLGNNNMYLMCNDTNAAHCYFGPANAPIVVTATSAHQAVTSIATCSHAAGALAHREIDCKTPPGIGNDWVWTVNVCGQASAPCTNAPAGVLPGCVVSEYYPPGIFSISGPGVVAAHTEGGESIIVVSSAIELNSVQIATYVFSHLSPCMRRPMQFGTHFGPLWTSGISPGTSPVDYLYYGPLTNPTLFKATGCSVSGTGANVTCLSSPGYGIGPFLYSLSIGGQVVNYTVPNAGYAAPVISSISGPFAINADTGGEPAGSGELCCPCDCNASV